MMVSPPEHHTLAPAEHYLRALWQGRWLYLGIVGVFVAGAAGLTAMQPKIYSSQSTLSGRQPPSIGALGLVYDSINAPGDGLPIGGRQELVPSRFAKRLRANKIVTLAAQDAGILAADARLDDGDIAKWVDADQLERTDLVSLVVRQPTPEGARNFAERIIARTLESNSMENTSADTRQMLTAQVARAEAAMVKAENDIVALAGAGNDAAAKIKRDRASMALDLARKEYEPLRRRLDVIDLLLTEQRMQLYVVDPPTLPLHPSYPRPVLNLSIGFILGVLVATFVVIVRSIFSMPGPAPR